MKKRRSQWPEAEDEFRPRPSHFRYLRAYSELLEEGGRINMAAIAKRMGISPAAFWAMRQRCAGLDRWVSEQLGRKNEHFANPIIRRMAVLAQQGSVDHAKVYFQVTGAMSGEGQAVSVGVNVHASPQIINIAVPRPGGQPVASSDALVKP